MKLRTFRYIVREGLLNFFRNKRAFFASCATCAAALVILGVFLILVLNVDENLASLGKRPQIQVYLEQGVSEARAGELADLARQAPGMTEFTLVTQEEAYARAQELLGEDRSLLDGIGADFLPESFIVKFEDAAAIDAFVAQIEAEAGVEKVFYPKQTVEFIERVSNWAKIFGLLLAAIPMLFAVFIMSNTIRIAVFERRGEISVMRYIGATESFIKWPFVVQGVIIGALGAMVAYIITGLGYALLERTFNERVSGVTGGLFSLAPMGSVTPALAAVFLAVGVLVGALGSVHPIRKYLRV